VRKMPKTFFRDFIGLEVKETKYQKLHVFSKILIPLSLSFSILFVKDVFSALILVFTSLFLCKIAGIPLGFIKKYLVIIISLTSFISLSFMLFTSMPGNVVFFEYTLVEIRAEKGVAEWKITISDASLNATMVFVSRIFAMVLSAVLLLGSVSDRELIWGLRSIGVPYGACLSIALFFKGLQLFVSDFYTVRDAMVIRGVDLDRMSLASKFKLYVNALIPLLTLLITRSYEISLALESRGISPSSKVPTRYHVPEFRLCDFAAIALSLAIAMFFYFCPSLWG